MLNHQMNLKKYTEKRRKAQRTDRANLAHDMSSTYQRTRRQNDVSGMPREKDSLMSLGKLKLEDLAIDEYLDNKIVQNAHINDSIRSTLSSLEANYGKPKTFTGIISENNSSEEADETD